ncbi:MAG: hypothetical protein HQ557_19210 [Bacteroidetes bacterium]|nr:hypothetical protein [Bacteroidota bacterium]
MLTIKDIEQLQTLYDATGGVIGEIDNQSIYAFYRREVNSLMFYITDSPWFNDNYDPNMIDYASQVVEELTLVEIRSLITWCSRHERFFSGHWVWVFENKIIPRVLARARELVGEV